MLTKTALFSTALLLLASSHAQAVDGMHVMRGDLSDMASEVIDIDPSRLERITMPRAVRGAGCTFYEDADGGGESWHKDVEWRAAEYADQTLYAQYVTTVGEWWDDRISSMSCDESAEVHCSAAVYPDPDKGGYEAIFWGSQGLFNLEDWGYDDTISSFVIFCNHMH